MNEWDKLMIGIIMIVILYYSIELILRSIRLKEKEAENARVQAELNDPMRNCQNCGSSSVDRFESHAVCKTCGTVHGYLDQLEKPLQDGEK